MEARAQAQNSPAASELWPFALATNAHPPPTVTYLPFGGVGSRKTPYWKSLALL